MAVTKEIKEIITTTVDEALKKTNGSILLERQNAMKEEAFKNTEKILYCYNILREHVSDEKEYLEMAIKSRSGSVVRYSKNKVTAPEEDQIIKDRKASYIRSKSDVERIEKALMKIEGKRGYEVIRYRYLLRNENDETYTYEEIADILSGQQEYSENINEKTVRNYKNTLVREMAIYLFGSDAV